MTSLFLMAGGSVAEAATITVPWLGGEVSIAHPDSVVIDQPFDITFSADASTLPAFTALAFHTFLDVSDTVDLTDSTWEYVFSSDDPNWNLSYTGDLGDATTPYTHDVDGYSIRLFDPVNGEWTWIWGDYNDKVEWALHDIVLLDDTSFTLTLDERFAVPTTFDFEVTGAAAAVPALSWPARAGTAFLLICAAASRTMATRRR
jgi:hypothetical protein